MKAKQLIPFLSITGLLVSAPVVVPAFASTIDTPPEHHGHRSGPPPEFFEACKNKAAGDTISLETPRGDQLEAVCEQKGNQLVARPLNPPSPPPPEKNQEQPPEKE
ncbi:MAG: hypothetical protein AB7U29_05290 [Desulfobulbus sp.]